jgi:hypothetical protein
MFRPPVAELLPTGAAGAARAVPSGQWQRAVQVHHARVRLPRGGRSLGEAPPFNFCSAMNESPCIISRATPVSLECAYSGPAPSGQVEPLEVARLIARGGSRPFDLAAVELAMGRKTIHASPFIFP